MLLFFFFLLNRGTVFAACQAHCTTIGVNASLGDGLKRFLEGVSTFGGVSHVDNRRLMTATSRRRLYFSTATVSFSVGGRSVPETIPHNPFPRRTIYSLFDQVW